MHDSGPLNVLKSGCMNMSMSAWPRLLKETSVLIKSEDNDFGLENKQANLASWLLSILPACYFACGWHGGFKLLGLGARGASSIVETNAEECS